MTAKIHIIAGATASGKSAIALERAQKTGGVIINADSQQLFRDLPILTARPTPEEEALVPHKLYGMLNADESPSVGKWLRFAKMEIDWARSNGQVPIVVGGTGLYIKALMEGIAEIPEIDALVRRQSDNDYAAMGKDAFMERLRAVDPQFFERLRVYDRQRLLRAYEVWLGTGKSLSWWQAREVKPAYSMDNFAIEIISLPREVLYARCDKRFEKMIEMGAVEEVRELIVSCQLPVTGIAKIIGVREIIDYIQGNSSLEAATLKAQQMTRNFAKRQMTWFRNQLS